MACIHGGYGPLDFNPRPPRGGRRAGPDLRLARHHISIHALREESDRSTLRIRQAARISIHALREESDFHTERPAIGRHDFNPRPPRGERPTVIAANNQLHEFQSTPSARRATVRCKNLILGQQISIHALREEGDAALTA